MSSRNQAWKKIRLLKAIICHFFGRMFHEKMKLTQDEEAIDLVVMQLNISRKEIGSVYLSN